MLRISHRTVERYVKDQIRKPRPDLAARQEREVKKRWQPKIRDKARQKAATTGGIVFDTPLVTAQHCQHDGGDLPCG